MVKNNQSGKTGGRMAFTQPFGKADTERVLFLNSLISANIIDYENESNE